MTGGEQLAKRLDLYAVRSWFGIKAALASIELLCSISHEIGSAEMLGWLRSFRQRMPAPLLGLDVGEMFIHMVELAQDKQGSWILERYASEPLQDQWMEDGQINNMQAVSGALQRLLKRSGTHAKNAVLAVPANCVISKRMALPSHLSAQEIEFQVEAEAQQFLSMPLDEVSLDFSCLGLHATSHDTAEILLVATRKARVQERYALAEIAGLNAVIVDVESFASIRAANRWIATLPNEVQQHPIALVQLKACNFSLQVLSNGQVVYEMLRSDVTSKASAMEDSLLAAKHDALQAPFFHAAHASSADFVSTDEDSAVALKESSIAQEVERALQLFFSSTPYPSIERIAIFGEATCWESMAYDIQAQTHTEVIVLNPFEGMKLAAGLQTTALIQEAPAYLTACGLAMRRGLP